MEIYHIRNTNTEENVMMEQEILDHQAVAKVPRVNIRIAQVPTRKECHIQFDNPLNVK